MITVNGICVPRQWYCIQLILKFGLRIRGNACFGMMLVMTDDDVNDVNDDVDFPCPNNYPRCAYRCEPNWLILVFLDVCCGLFRSSWLYKRVCPSVRPSICPSIHPSIHASIGSAFFCHPKSYFLITEINGKWVMRMKPCVCTPKFTLTSRTEFGL